MMLRRSETFKQKQLIFVPPEWAYTGPNSRRWISFEHAVREGPLSMQSKFDVVRAYPARSKLFEEQLVVPRSPENIFVLEWQALLTGDQNLRTYNRELAIINEICEAVVDPKRRAGLTNWLPQLAKLTFLRVRYPDGKFFLTTVNSDFYLPDKSGVLAELFKDACWVLHTDKDLPLIRLRPLLDHPDFAANAKQLEDHVRIAVAYEGAPRLQKTLSRYYSSRSIYLKRYVCDPILFFVLC